MPTGGTSVRGSRPARWRAKPRATAMRLTQTVLVGSASGCCAHAMAASIVMVSRPNRLKVGNQVGQQPTGIGQLVPEGSAQPQVVVRGLAEAGHCSNLGQG